MDQDGDWMCGVCDEVMYEKTSSIACQTCRNYAHLAPHEPNCDEKNIQPTSTELLNQNSHKELTIW